jgi:hypothetical protein
MVVGLGAKHADGNREFLRQLREREKGKTATPAPVQEAMGSGRRGQRAKPIPDDEANILVRDYLNKNENAKAREVSRDCGIALGRVSGLPAWQAHQARKNQSPQPGKSKQPQQLTTKMLAAIGKENDPGARLANAEETAWRYLVEAAKTPAERARLNEMTPEEKAEAIRLVIDQFGDEDSRGKPDAP